MEVKELRIGNLIEFGRKENGDFLIGEVEGLHGDLLGGTVKIKNHNQTFLAQQLFPIPITDDYFDVISGREKMITYFDVADDCKHSLVFEIDHDGNYYYTGGEGVKMSRTIQYVHELQNLAWELERAEITFK